MEISKSDIVVSCAGRDKGMLFYVLDTDGVYVSLANGKERKVEKPKRKNSKHVRIVLRPDSEVAAQLSFGDSLLNSELRRKLTEFGREFNVQTKEGA
ncbi:MAG: KOW domain-containing RNA-binding protein [Oscillospiraceae bacterium]|jgi:hypothetical protein|nr:KOW domain-containing RNA-binding protein [Oscillospiraceae bacterium]